MFFGAKNQILRTSDFDMDFVSFGKGRKNLVIIPGLGDGLRTVKGMAAPLAVMYRHFAASHKVYILSRKNNLRESYSTKEMAADYAAAMAELGIANADVLGISQGGMIAQYLAIDHPHMVNKLVLAVTLCRQNNTVQNAIGSWINLAKAGDSKSIIIDTAEKSYTQARLKKYRPFYPLLARISKPKDFGRFIIQANACISHDAHDKLHCITCPTLVIGADDDKVVGGGTSEEIAQRIGDSKLFIYKGFGHAVYEEAKDFNRRVSEFLSDWGVWT